eukprot:1713211-Heterocapsa_arctica.AAC.1
MPSGVAMGRSVRRMALGEVPTDLVKQVMWSDAIGEPMIEDAEKSPAPPPERTAVMAGAGE